MNSGNTLSEDKKKQGKTRLLLALLEAQNPLMKSKLNSRVVPKSENTKDYQSVFDELQELGAISKSQKGYSLVLHKGLIDYKKFDLTRGCLVRSKKVGRGTKTEQCLNKLLSPSFGGEWVLLKPEEIKSLLAIHAVMNSRDDYELSETQITDFIIEKRIAIDNYLIREILSDPSGIIPSEAVDEDN